MIRRLLHRALLATVLLLPFGVQAADAVPKLARHVTDLTGTLSAQQVDQLDAQLVTLGAKTKGAQLVVLMVNSTGSQDIEGYSLAVAEANKVGRKGTDDGVLLLIAKADHRVRIEVGYGLEGAIPDAATARIIREYIAPKFRGNDYFGGISDAVGAAHPVDQWRSTATASAGRARAAPRAGPASRADHRLFRGNLPAQHARRHGHGSARSAWCRGGWRPAVAGDFGRRGHHRRNRRWPADAHAWRRRALHWWRRLGRFRRRWLGWWWGGGFGGGGFSGGGGSFGGGGSSGSW